jgi:hypothetical protein
MANWWFFLHLVYSLSLARTYRGYRMPTILHSNRFGHGMVKTVCQNQGMGAAAVRELVL